MSGRFLQPCRAPTIDDYLTLGLFCTSLPNGARHMPKIDLDACPERSGTLYPEPYRATVRDRRVRQVGAAAGLSDFGVNVVRLAPGVWSSQRHWHDDDDEVVVMLDGELVLIEDDGRAMLRWGDIAAWPKGATNGQV